MVVYISEFSKYIIALLITLYTYESFAVFRYDNEERRNGIYVRQNLLMFAIHFSCFLVICFETGDMTYLFFYAFQQIVLYAAIALYRMLYPKANRLIVNNMCMLLSIGFVILTRLGMSKAVKQCVIVTGSLTIALIIPYFVHK
ncbi:MAG: FtsW/RodA/SpoVE family cell cycle protein, partial [Lachnospiraceae bacterium]|nr:FtsW/RodA/SpoVE family cell cycle protein [Lachnospiraceae bacterium]